jgi:AraC-like DNA-binding protein
MEKLKSIMHDLCAVTGINFEITDANFHFLYRCKNESPFCTAIQNTSIGANKCLCSDTSILEECKQSRSFQSHVCHAGLTDAATPIIKNDVIVGYIVAGPIRSSLTPEEIREKLSWMNESVPRLLESYEEIPCFSDARIDSLSNLLSHILFENAIEIDYSDFISFATAYIKNNLNSDLSIPHLCEALHVSKNVLYKSFRENRGCTVTEYINRQRIKQAQKLLRESDMPIYHIATSVGIPNYTYFCRLFKKLTGLSPIVYRNNV